MTVIFFSTSAGLVQRVAASGGAPTAVTKLRDGETEHWYPQVLPGGQKLLFLTGGGKQPGIWVQDLTSGERTFLFASNKRAVVAGVEDRKSTRLNSSH